MSKLSSMRQLLMSCSSSATSAAMEERDSNLTFCATQMHLVNSSAEYQRRSRRSTYQRSTARSTGGADQLSSGIGHDILIGGPDDDVIVSTGGDNTVFGDNGLIDYVSLDGDPTNVDKLQTLNPTDGGNDHITTEAGHDRVLGGAGDDVIKGTFTTDVIRMVT